MNSAENKIFLKFIERQLDKKYEIYSDEKGLYFWGEESHKITLTSHSNYVNFIIHNSNNINNSNIKLAEVSISFDECKPLLDYMYGAYLKTQQNSTYYTDNKDFIQSSLKEVKNYLKTCEINENDDLSINTIIEIPNTYPDHILRVGHMFYANNKKPNMLTLGFTNIPLTLYQDNEHHYVQINLIIPYWEINQYPCLKALINVPERLNTLSELLENLKKNKSSLSNSLFYDMMDSKVENKNIEIISKKKI